MTNIEEDTSTGWNEVDTDKPVEDKEDTVEFETDVEDAEVKVEAVVEDEDLEELEGVKTKGAEKRIRQLVQQRNERDTAIQNLSGELDHLRSELVKSHYNTKAHEASSLTSRESELEEHVKAAEKDYLRAFEESDQKEVLEAQNKINDAKTDLKIIKARKVQLENEKHRSEILASKEYQETKGYEAGAPQQYQQPQAQAATPVPDKLASGWASDNDWFGTDEVTTAVALAIDQKLKGEGYDPTTKEFYNEIDKRLQQELPHKFNSDRVMDNTGKPSQVVAGSSRKSSPIGNKVKLSKRDVELAKKWDIPLDRYAAEKRKVSKLDEGNYSTIETKRA
jgi:hypothetical protein